MPALELCLPHGSLPALLRLPTLRPAGAPSPAEVVWLDTPCGDLAAHGKALHTSAGRWRLERLAPNGALWPAMAPAPVLAEGSAEECGVEPSTVAAQAGFRGEQHVLHFRDGDTPPIELTVTAGQLLGVVAERPVCRLRLDGTADGVQAAAMGLAGSLPVEVPRAGLAAEALAAARGQQPPPRHLGAPVLQPGPLSDSIATIISQLLDAMLHWSGPAAAGSTPTPVHQMRVATRRLRSALSIFKHAAACPEVDPLNGALRDTAAILGAARDWDVFLGGMGAQLRESFPGERSVGPLLSAAQRQRAAAYGALASHLASPEFRSLQLSLGCAAALRPWERERREILHNDTQPFAADVLNRRLRKVIRAGRGLKDLPIEALHELRKDCKRLRYAAEFFEPLFPHKPAQRFLRRLSVLQEELGMLNDGAVATGLMSHLGRSSRSYAAGLVVGYATAGLAGHRASVVPAWRKFKKADPFWS